MLGMDVLVPLTISFGVLRSTTPSNIIIFLVVGFERSFVFVVEGEGESSGL